MSNLELGRGGPSQSNEKNFMKIVTKDVYEEAVTVAKMNKEAVNVLDNLDLEASREINAMAGDSKTFDRWMEEDDRWARSRKDVGYRPEGDSFISEQIDSGVNLEGNKDLLTPNGDLFRGFY